MTARKMGQHFLIDEAIAEREVVCANISNHDIILEVGPGKGILTHKLAQHARRVIAIELDEHLVAQLTPTLPQHVTLIHGDVMQVDFFSLPPFTKIVSNLPFQISSPITFKFLEYPFTTAVLIYQQEFADRLIAQPGSKAYSRLSVGVYYKAYCKFLEHIPKTCFSPQPHVDSAMIKLTPRNTPPFPIINEPFFFALIKTLFSHRRKKIRTILRNQYCITDKTVPYLDNRVEELSPEQIGELSNILYPYI